MRRLTAPHAYLSEETIARNPGIALQADQQGAFDMGEFCGLIVMQSYANWRLRIFVNA